MVKRFAFLALLVGCSPVKGKLVDARQTPDTAIDALGHGMVIVTVLDVNGNGAPVVGVHVAFLDGDGNVEATPVTDSNGKVTADVKAGSSVSVVQQTSATSTQIITLFEIQPNDNIVIGRKVPDSTVAGNMTFNVAIDSGAQSYTVATPCGEAFPAAGSGAGPATETGMTVGCTSSPMEVVAIAFDSTGNIQGSVDSQNVNFTAGGTFTLPTAYSFPLSFQATYTNIPSVTAMDVQRAGPVTFNRSIKSLSSPNASETVTGSVVSSPNPATISSRFSDVANAQQFVAQALPGNAQTYALDVSSTLLAWLGAPTFDPGSATVTIPVANAGTSNATPDAFLIEAFYSRTVGGTAQQFIWLAAQPTYGNMKLPALPSVVGDVNPKSTDTGAQAIAIAIESDQINGYAQAHLDIVDMFSALNNGIITGRTRASESPFNFGLSGK
jgi:hypothetical protein